MPYIGHAWHRHGAKAYQALSPELPLCGNHLVPAPNERSDIGTCGHLAETPRKPRDSHPQHPCVRCITIRPRRASSLRSAFPRCAASCRKARGTPKGAYTIWPSDILPDRNIRDQCPRSAPSLDAASAQDLLNCAPLSYLSWCRPAKRLHPMKNMAPSFPADRPSQI